MAKKSKSRRRSRKRGRPHKQPQIPVRKIADLAAIGCTVNEIANLCELSKDTVERNYAALIDKGRGEGKERLRRMQWKSAERGNTGMQIWLGKQILDQRDKQEIIETSDPLAELLLEFRAAHNRDKAQLTP